MLRISTTQIGNAAATIRLEGRVMGAWVDEVRRSCRQALEGGRRVTVDLAAVSFVDAEGAVMLRDLSARDVALANCTPFVASQLRG
jgi:anti-anti-sigma regulatory factor